MLLKELIQDVYLKELSKTVENISISGISSDSRHLRPGDIFIALQGPSMDGEKFILDAIRQGAAAIVKSNRERVFPSSQVPILEVENPRAFLYAICRKFYDDPSQKLKIIGVTGTNGKTTITYLLESILQQKGKKCGVIGTVNYRIGNQVYPANNTTPGLVDTYQLWQKMIQQQCQFCFMEVSSHALAQERISPADFYSAIFTNLTGDHLDYHKDMEDYFLAKAKLFVSLPATATAIINQDDFYGPRLIPMTKSKVMTYGIKNTADVMAQNIVLGLQSTEFSVRTRSGPMIFRTGLIGQHNVYNILAVIAEGLSLGFPLEQIKEGIENFTVVPGRLERVECGQDFCVFVDYAHTEDALKNVLLSLKQIHHSRLIVVFGCGGDRDRTKRPKMGKVADDLADQIILTNDNPRSEEPLEIVREILSGISGKSFEVILDRKEAICHALKIARQDDIVLIAGKGHEDYQIFKNERIHFDDREVVRDFFKKVKG